MKFIDVKTELAFKKVFGSEGSKPLLISFLNSLINFGKNEKIEDLIIVDPKADNIPIEVIIKSTGLSKTDIEFL